MDKWTAEDIPDHAGRVAVITGANSGLGFEIASVLAARGAQVVLAVRNLDKGKDAAARITASSPGAEVSLQKLDLASLDSVREAADQLRSAYPGIDVLVNNAGVMWTPKTTTADGFELQLASNHLGHFALTGLVLDRLLETPGSRVVSITSLTHWFGRIDFDDLQWQRRRYGREGAYAQSKLANLLFTYELQRRLAPSNTTISVAAHPGFSASQMMENTPPSALRVVGAFLWPLATQTAAMGALPALRAATDPAVQGGQYFGPSKLLQTRGHPKTVRSSARSHDEEMQRRLWSVSETLTGVKFP